MLTVLVYKPQIFRRLDLRLVLLNNGLSPDFSVQLKVSLSERLSERLNQKVKSPTVLTTNNSFHPHPLLVKSKFSIVYRSRVFICPIAIA